jgi:citrate lyase subunit beta / citryl-CoA lyase
MDPRPLTWLYVPADRPDRIEKAIASRAHAVIVDLEDAVAPAAKRAARAGLDDLLGRSLDSVVYVRVNALATPFARDDLATVARLDGVTGVTVAKVETPVDARRAVELAGGKQVQCLVESALGVEHAFAIASVSGVTGISLGEADLGGETSASGRGLDWARSRIVNAACAAGLPRPPQSVYANVRDLDGLRASCLHGRELGHLGRTAIHPGQLPVIESVYLPSDAEAERARAFVAGFAERADQGVGAYALDDGSFVDAALVRSARELVALADRYGTREG